MDFVTGVSRKLLLLPGTSCSKFLVVPSPSWKRFDCTTRPLLTKHNTLCIFRDTPRCTTGRFGFSLCEILIISLSDEGVGKRHDRLVSPEKSHRTRQKVDRKTWKNEFLHGKKQQ
jgi:hypothetical protein